MNRKFSMRNLVLGLSLAGLAASLPLPALAQAAYADPESAAEAFVAAVRSRDASAKAQVLGPQWQTLVPADGVDETDRQAFLRMAGERLKVNEVRNGVAEVTVGAVQTWTLPIPIVADAQGQWRFDLAAGREQVRERVIGRNELSAMQAMLAYLDAQREYAQADRNGDGVLEYAQKFVGRKGLRDGLIWEPGLGNSPLGPDFAPQKPGAGYHGYRFRILTGQGPTAPGGARDYMIGGRLLTGYALLAWPVTYGETGVMTFMVNQGGKILERDLGPQTPLIVQQIQRYEPDAGWRPATP